MKLIDISQELFSGRVYPGDIPPSFERVKTVECDKYSLTNITMCVHNGTHIDAPKHFIRGGKAVHDLDLPVFYGKCTVVEFSGVIGKDDMSEVLKNCHERLLLKGDCRLSDGTASLIAHSHIRLLGVESQSVGDENYPLRIHVILLDKGIIPLEGLNLSTVTPGEYTLAAFPLNLQGSDGSPVRAVLIDDGINDEEYMEKVDRTSVECTPQLDKEPLVLAGTTPPSDNVPVVTFHIQSSFDFSVQLGGYRMLMQFGEQKKYLVESRQPGASNVTMIILAVIRGIEQLRKPCHIRVHSDALFGISDIYKNGHVRQQVSAKAANRTLKEHLRYLIETGGHTIENVADGGVKSVLLRHERLGEIGTYVCK